MGAPKKKRKTKKKELTFFDHLIELRMRLIISLIAMTLGSIIAFFFYDLIIQVLSLPFQQIQSSSMQNKLFLNSLFEGFQIKVKVSFLAGFILSFPVHLFNFIKFILPGLKKKEKRIIAVSLIMSTILVILSVYYGYFKIIPLSVRFLTSHGFIPSNVGILLNFGKNIFYIFQFMLASLAIFQVPLVIELLLVMNIVTRKQLIKSMRYIVVGIFVVSAILTPPDVFSQLAFSLPLLILMGLVLVIAYIFKFGEEK